MPGVDLDLDYPLASDTMADFRAKLVIALEAIAADLEPRITAGMLDLTTAVSLGGAPLTNVGGIRLSGGESTEVGTVYVDSELHVVTPDGDIQVTSGGGLNIASLGTIGGDYGGVNPAAVTYDDTSGEFRFTEAPGTWADLVADDLVTKGALGSVRWGVEAGLSGAKSFLINALPASGVGGLAYDVSLSSVVDPSVTRETLTHLFTSINCSGTATMSVIKHGDQTVSQAADVGSFNSGTITTGISAFTNRPYVRLATSAIVYNRINGLRVGNRVKSFVVYGLAAVADPTFAVYHQEGLTVAGPQTGETLHTYTSAGDLTAAFAVTITLDTAITMLPGSVIHLKCTAAGGQVDLFSISATFDQP